MSNVHTHEMDDDGKFKDLALENEILKLKMQAEMGASFHTEIKIPPEIEAMFLKQVMDFEEKYQQAPLVTIYKLIGSPLLPDYRELTDQELSTSTQELLEMLEAKAIKVEWPDADPVKFYRFLTEKLLFEETRDLVIEGMVKCYDIRELQDDDEYGV